MPQISDLLLSLMWLLAKHTILHARMHKTYHPQATTVCVCARMHVWNVFTSVCRRTVPPQWTATVTLMGERAMSEDTCTPVVRLTAGINLACVKKRQGCNYPETEGQRDGSLFATAWTPLLSKSENGIYLLTRKETALPFCPLVSRHAPPLWGPTCPQHSVVMTSFLSGHLFSPINGNSSVQSCIEIFMSEGQWQPDIHSAWLKQMTNADSHIEKGKAINFSIGSILNVANQFQRIWANGHEQCSREMSSPWMPSFRCSNLSNAVKFILLDL